MYMKMRVVAKRKTHRKSSILSFGGKDNTFLFGLCCYSDNTFLLSRNLVGMARVLSWSTEDTTSAHEKHTFQRDSKWNVYMEGSINGGTPKLVGL